MMFALARQIPAADASTQAGKWEKIRFMGVELTGKTLGLIGCGNIGSIVADRAIGLKMKVHRLRSLPLARSAPSTSASRRSSSTSCSRRADFITLHTPLTDQTRNIICRRALAKTKKGVRIINCARGGLVDEAALEAALEVRPCRRRRARRLRRGAGQGEPAVRHAERRLHAAPRRLDHARRRRTSRCRSPSRWPTTCCTGAVTNALNMPSVSAEEAPRLKP